MRFKRSSSLLARSTLVAGLLLPTLALAGDVIVIAHGSVNLTADEIRDVFVGEKQSAGSTRLVVLDNGSAQADFLAKVVKVDAAKYASIWAKKGFREGINPPAVKGGDAEVIAAVKSTPGAVGYVSKAPADVKVIQKY
jgi:ABC-type phosphate transport system substrate-binding protein